MYGFMPCPISFQTLCRGSAGRGGVVRGRGGRGLRASNRKGAAVLHMQVCDCVACCLPVSRAFFALISQSLVRALLI